MRPRYLVSLPSLYLLAVPFSLRLHPSSCKLAISFLSLVLLRLSPLIVSSLSLCLDTCLRVSLLQLLPMVPFHPTVIAVLLSAAVAVSLCLDLRLSALDVCPRWEGSFAV